ncbi:MAG: hypothetical protein ACREIP_08280 [Alphaproteobacteria bacterium]
MTGNDMEREALARFETLLDAYGAEPRRWPADRRAWAEALLARSPQAKALRNEAARLDDLIDSAGIDPVPAHLAGRVLASAPAAAPARSPGWFSAWWKPVTSLACAAVLGIALGGIVSPFEAGTADAAEPETVSLDIGAIPEIEL